MREELQRPLSILMVIQRYPPLMGGAEMQASRLSKSLRKRGHRVEVLTIACQDLPRRWTDPDGTPVRSTGHHTPVSLRTLGLVIELVRVMVQEGKKFDVIHFHLLNSHAFLGTPVAWLLGLKTVVKIAGSGPQGDVRRLSDSKQHAWRFRYLRHTVNRFIALNPEAMQELIEAGVEKARIARVPNGLDTDLFRPVDATEKAVLRRKLGISSGPVVVFTGCFRQIKRVPLLVDAFASAHRACPEASLILVGEGEEEPLIRERITAHGLEASVQITGGLSSLEVLSYLQAADIHALISDSEGLSNALLEAMAVGLAPLVSAVPGNIAVIDDGVQGVHVQPGDVESMAQGLTRLLRDADLRTRLGQQARARVVARYAMSSIAAQYEQLYRDMLMESAGNESGWQRSLQGLPQIVRRFSSSGKG